MTSLIAAIVLIAFVTASMGMIAYWSTVAVHIRRTLKGLPTARDGVALSEQSLPRDRSLWPKVCVVVPAHNEERCIGNVASALAAQDYPSDRLSVVFALDRCTDGTADELRREAGHIDRFEVITIDHCPDGWAGKTNAIQQGVASSRSASGCDLLLLLDADTTPAPECLRAAVALSRHRNLPLLSLLSTLTTDEWFERICQPAACMEMVRQYPLLRANSRAHRRPFANGQFILVERSAFESLGGFERVKDSVLEDVELARIAHRAGLDIGLFIADRMLICRMYPDWTRFVRGWKRIFSECANRRTSRLRRTAWRMVLIGVVLPLLGAAGVGAGAGMLASTGDLLGLLPLVTGVLGLAIFAGVVAWMYRLSHAPVSAIFGYPIGTILVARIMLQAACDLDRGRPTVWGGREYERVKR